jgi:hypothetical protein
MLSYTERVCLLNCTLINVFTYPTFELIHQWQLQPNLNQKKKILMVDRFNHKLKLLTENGAVVSTTVVQEGEPWDVVYVNRKGQDLHFCAVSVPTARMVLFVRVCDKIDIVRRIVTPFGAYCRHRNANLGLYDLHKLHPKVHLPELQSCLPHLHFQLII